MTRKLDVVSTSKFKKDLRTIIKSGHYDLAELDYIIELLQHGKKLPGKYQDHALSGSWNDFRDCHIRPDWILIYRIDDDVLTLTLSRTGSHANIF